MFTSPLEAGQTVTCTDGLVVRILQDPIWDNVDKRFTVDVLVVGGNARYSAGQRDTFVHMSPDRFGCSIFQRIEGPGPTLEQEFFGRVLNGPASHD